LVHVYRGRIPLYHLDLYRLEGVLALQDVVDPAEMEAMGAVAEEWADRAPGWVPADALWLELAVQPPGPHRRVAARAAGRGGRRLLDHLARGWDGDDAARRGPEGGTADGPDGR